MGQKTDPRGFRLGINRGWDSRWYAEKNYAELLSEDQMIRNYLRQRLRRAAVSKIEIDRTLRKVTVTIHTARPGIVIGRRGVEVDKLRDELRHLTKKDIFINIEEIRISELDAELIAENVVRQLEARVSYRRAMKRSVQSAMRMGAKGIRISCGGRLAGAEIARTEWYREGRVPLHTIRAGIDYARGTAFTTSGTIGVKVWVFKGEVLEKAEQQ